MNPGLLYLLRMGPVSRMRSIRRRLGGRRGLLVIAAVVLVVLVVFVPQLWLAFRERDPAQLARVAAGLRRYGPVALLFLVLSTGARGRGLYLRPPELQFLLPAPLSRRELLLYLVVSRLGTAIWSTLWVAVFTIRFAPTVGGAVTALFLANAFLLILVQAFGLAFAAISARLGRRLRQVAGAALLLAFLIALFEARAHLPAGAGLLPLLDQALDLPWVHVLCWPTRLFVEIFVADSLLAWAGWTAAAVGMISLLFLLMVAADVAWEASALEQSQQVQDTLRRMRSGGPAARRPGLAGISLAEFPRLGGAGALAWRQMLEMLRNFRGFLSLLVSFSVMLIILPFDQMSGPTTVVIVVFAGFFFQSSPFLAFDFRRDLDRMAWLRSLPLPPLAVVLGEVVPSALLQTLIQVLFLLAFALWRGPVDAGVWTAALLALPSFNLLAAGLYNEVFLIWPRRLLPEQGADFHFMGRVWGEALLLMLLLGVAGGLAFLAGSAVWRWSGGVPLASGLAGTAVLLLLCLPLYRVLARTFANFDVSRHLP